MTTLLEDVASRLAAAGCVTPYGEAAVLVEAAGATGDLDALVRRRAGGEPLAWVVGSVTFCGVQVNVHPGVYVPRPHSEALARRAASHLPPAGTAVDLCTGSGAVACVLQLASPSATVLATDVDPLAVGCARDNGVETLLGDLDEPLPAALLGAVDVITAVVPYVPTGELVFLARDVLAFEPRRALDGGGGGTRYLAAVIDRSTRWLRAGGWLLVEIGGDQAHAVADRMRTAGFVDISVLADEDGDHRAVEGRLPD